MSTGLKRCAGYGLALVACVWLAGCAGQLAEDSGPKTEDVAAKQAPAKVRIPSPDHFTTKGKPTKTILTPNGPVSVYDPVQDPQVRAAFDIIYARGDVTFGDVSRYNGYTRTGPEGTGNDPVKEAEIVRRAREIQYNDMMRLGCTDIRTTPHLVYGSSFLKAPCKDSRLGELTLSVCEKENLVTNKQLGGPAFLISPDRKEELLAKSRKRLFREESYPAWKKKSQYNKSEIFILNRYPIIPKKLPNIPSLLIGNKSGVSKSEIFRVLTRIDCTKW